MIFFNVFEKNVLLNISSSFIYISKIIINSIIKTNISVNCIGKFVNIFIGKSIENPASGNGVQKIPC